MPPVLFLIALLLAASPAAADPYAECVQRQLAFLGHDPGPVDGRIGPRTRRAATAYRATRADDLNGIPGLGPRTAVAWCREIGAGTGGARSFWPARAALDVRTGKAPGASEREAFARDVHTRVRRFFAREFGLLPASAPAVVISQDLGEAVGETVALLTRRGYRATQVRNAVRRRCRDRDSGAFFAERDLIVFCLPDMPATTAEWREDFDRTGTAIYVHEYAHQIQREFALDIRPAPPQRGLPPMGPAWLSEGMADFFMNEWLARDHRDAGTALSLLYFDHLDADDYDAPLSALRPNKALEDAESYLVSRLAVRALIMRTGRDSPARYLRALTTGIGPEAAFREAFGMSIEDYEAAFEGFRGTFKATAAYARSGSG